MRQNVTPFPFAFTRLLPLALLCTALLLPACASQEPTTVPPDEPPASAESPDAERESDVIVVRPWMASDSLYTFRFSDGDSTRVFSFRSGDGLRIDMDGLRRSMPNVDSLRASMLRRMDSLRVFRDSFRVFQMDSLRAFRFETEDFDGRLHFWSDRNRARVDSLRDLEEPLMRDLDANRSERLRERAERLREQAERLEEEAERLEREAPGDGEE